MKKLDRFDSKALSKRLYRTNIMPSGNSESFSKLSNQLIASLQKGIDFEKLRRILSSELISTYGLTVNEKQIDDIALEVYSWYTDKF